MTRTLFTSGGTWSFWDQGFQADLGRAIGGGEWDSVAAEIFGTDYNLAWRWQPVDYNTSFGPVGGDIQSLSYKESVRTGVDENIRLINATPGQFALAGYSMGGEVVGRTVLELQSGALRHRLADCLGTVTFGDPTRQKSDPNPAGGKGWGISKLVLPPSTIARRTYARAGDIYCTCPDGDTGEKMHAVYDTLTDMQLHDFPMMVTDLFTQIGRSDSLMNEALALLANPAAGLPGLIGALIALMQFAITNAHGSYGPEVADAVGFLLSL